MSLRTNPADPDPNPHLNLHRPTDSNPKLNLNPMFITQGRLNASILRILKCAPSFNHLLIAPVGNKQTHPC